MAIKGLNPYLNFNGTAEKAIKLYEQALGAKVEGGIMRFSEGPADMPPVPPEYKNRVLHATLRLGENGVVMISDCPPNETVTPTGAAQIALHFDTVEDLEKKFQAMSKDSKVTMPLADMFWGARFGMLIDPYGVHWMFSCELKKAK